MPDEQPRYFTLIDLLWEWFHLCCVTVGCYLGWKVGETFFALFVGGLVGRVVTVSLVLAIRSRLPQFREDPDLPEPH